MPLPIAAALRLFLLLAVLASALVDAASGSASPVLFDVEAWVPAVSTLPPAPTPGSTLDAETDLVAQVHASPGVCDAADGGRELYGGREGGMARERG